MARPRFAPILVAVVAMLGGFALAGCPDKKPKTPACKTDKECTTGLVCVENRCVECGEDSDCPKDKRCSDHACVTAPECVRDDQCSDGKVCQAGACKPCGADGECGPGGSCEAGGCKRANKCTKDDNCADDEDCKDGFCLKANRPTTTTDASCALQTVYFGFDQSVIQQSEGDRLSANAACIEKTKGRIVLLSGHTDTSGTEEYNIALSERRAQSVADYLSRLGTDPARMQVVPKGETEPLGMGDDKDRRVEFSWH